jgi:stage II sporulation protein M
MGYLLSFNTFSRDPELFKVLEEAAMPFLRELGEMVFGGSLFWGSLILFMHNLAASLQVILLGIILGIPTLFSALANGSLLGAFAARMAREGILPLHLVLVGILPHGIFELPAFFISAGLGLKLGYHVVFPLPGRSRKATLGHIFSEVRDSLPFIALLLAVAALLEVFVTPGLIRVFLRDHL